MIYDEFINNLNCYLEIYKKGLKKQANAKMKEVVCNLHNTSNGDLDYIMHRFLSEYCDTGIWNNLKERGNGDIPFALKEFIRIWLTPRCEEKKMPELRWYYELYCNDRIGYEFATKYLEYAYLSNECDQKTVDMLFDSYLDTLGWGAHHFPEACIIQNNVREESIKNCEKIMQEKYVNEYLQHRFQYYKILYNCYDKYKEEGQKKDFDEYLKEANIDFHYSKSFYYEK